MCMLPLAEISSRTRPFASRYSNMPMDTSVRHHFRVCIFINMCAREGGVAARCTCTSIDIQVQPGPRHLPSSTVSGSGLSLATAGVAAHVVLTVHQKSLLPHTKTRTHTCKRKRAHTYVRTRKRRCETSTQTGGPNPTSRRQALLSQYSSLQQAAEDRPCRLLPCQ